MDATPPVSWSRQNGSNDRLKVVPTDSMTLSDGVEQRERADPPI